MSGSPILSDLLVKERQIKVWNSAGLVCLRDPPVLVARALPEGTPWDGLAVQPLYSTLERVSVEVAEIDAEGCVDPSLTEKVQVRLGSDGGRRTTVWWSLRNS